MKKILNLLFLFTSLFLLTKCSSDDSSTTNNEGPLFVNGVTYQIGTNSSGNTYNSTMYSSSTNYKTRTFTILRGSSTTPENSESINLTISYPIAQSSINGTYNLTVDATDAIATNSAYSICSLDTFNSTYGGENIFASGTVTVVDNGNNNFKLTFNSVTLKNQDSPTTDTRTIIGFCQTTFTQL